jgi:hypothetical protein
MRKGPWVTARGMVLLILIVVLVAMVAATTMRTKASWHSSPPQHPYVKQVTMRGYDNTQWPRKWLAYRCAKRLVQIYVATGRSAKKNGSTFNLTGQASSEVYNQQSVTLSVQLSGSEAVKAIIVHSEAPFYGNDNDYVGHENDTLAPVHIEKQQYLLKTADYVQEQSKGDEISGVTLCLTAPSASAGAS